MATNRTGIHPDSCTCSGVMCAMVAERDAKNRRLAEASSFFAPMGQYDDLLRPLVVPPYEAPPLRSLSEAAATQPTDYYRGFAGGRAEGAAEVLTRVNEYLRELVEKMRG